jgi:copper chaperone CopZ
VVKVDVNFLSGTATIVYDETRIVPDDIKTFIAECGYQSSPARQRQSSSKKLKRSALI